MKFLNTIVILSALSINICWAGPSVGGGGDVVILPDDSVVLADPFIDSGAAQPNNMPPLRSISPRILQLINMYDKITSNLFINVGGKDDIHEVMRVLGTRKNNLRFYAVQTVEELNLFCASGGKKVYKLPGGSSVQQVACTSGDETFLVEPIFIRLSLRDQSLLFIHERLTTLRDQYGGKNYSAIARFTTGLNVYLNLYSEQSKNNFRYLSEQEQKNLTELYLSSEEILKRDSEVGPDSFQIVAHRYGGGRAYLNANVSENSLLSLQSFVGENSTIGENSKIINTIVPVDSKIGNNVELIESTVGKSIVGDNSKIIHSKLFYNSLGKNSVIKNSTLYGWIVAGDNTFIEDSSLEATLTLGSDVIFKNATMRRQSAKEFSLKFASGEKLISSEILGDVYEAYYPLGVMPRPIKYELNLINYSFVVREKLPKTKTSVDVKFSNARGDSVSVKAKLSLTDKTGMFGDKKRYTYTLSETVASVNIQNFQRNTNERLLTVDGDGKIVMADYLKNGFVVEDSEFSNFIELITLDQYSYSYSERLEYTIFNKAFYKYYVMEAGNKGKYVFRTEMTK